jgi:hypothetical protein
VDFGWSQLFQQFFRRSNKPLKRFEIPVGAQHPTERGVLMRTRLACASQWVDVKSPPLRSPTFNHTRVRPLSSEQTRDVRMRGRRRDLGLPGVSIIPSDRFSTSSIISRFERQANSGWNRWERTRVLTSLSVEFKLHRVLIDDKDGTETAVVA